MVPSVRLRLSVAANSDLLRLQGLLSDALGVPLGGAETIQEAYRILAAAPPATLKQLVETRQRPRVIVPGRSP